MKKQYTKTSQLIAMLLLVFMANIHAQEKIDLVGTNLKIVLPEGFILTENTAAISNKNYSITFMEMAGIRFSEQITDFENIEADYAEKGIKVSENEQGKIGKYNALKLVIDSSPAVHQIFFGDDSFCGLVNIIANDTEYILQKDEIESVLSTIE